jgi:hypothetical protein
VLLHTLAPTLPAKVAEKQIAKELDVSPDDVDAAIQEAAGEIS